MSSLASPCASLHASSFLQVFVAVFSEARKRQQWQLSRQNQFVAVFYNAKEPGGQGDDSDSHHGFTKGK